MNEKRKNRWLLTAMIAPVIQAASNCSWIAALIVGLLCGSIVYGMRCLGASAAKTKLLTGIQWLWMLLLVSEFLHWIMLYWPNNSNYHAAPLLVLALAAYSLGKGKRVNCYIASVLFWVVALLLGSVLLSGLGEMRIENLKPQWQMQTAYYIVVMLIPAMVSEAKNNGIEWEAGTLGVMTSVITTGVLSLNYIERTKGPFYVMTRALSMFDTAEHFESFAAAGMTLGYFALISVLLQTTSDAWGYYKSPQIGIWVSTAFIAMVFLSGMRMNSRLLAAGTLLIWVLLPALEKVLQLVKKPMEK